MKKIKVTEEQFLDATVEVLGEVTGKYPDSINLFMVASIVAVELTSGFLDGKQEIEISEEEYKDKLADICKKFTSNPKAKAIAVPFMAGIGLFTKPLKDKLFSKEEL